jgi:hypothetical protein
MQKSIANIILQNKNTCLAYNHHFFEKQNRKKLFDNHIFSQPPMLFKQRNCWHSDFI